MNNPIMVRELVNVIRNPWAPILLLLLVAAVSILVLLRWPPDATVSLSGEESMQVFRILGFGLLTGLILLSPAFPATSIVRERRKGTMQLLLNSPLTPWQIYIGKFVGVSGYILLLTLASLPAAAACYAMGGVGLWQHLGAVYMVLILLSWQYTALGLWVSSRSMAIDASLRMTYLLVLVLAVLSVIPAYFLMGLTVLQINTPFLQANIPVDGPLGVAVDWLRCLSPFPAMMQAMGQEGIAARGLADQTNLMLRYALVCVLTVGLFAWLTVRQLGGFMLDRPRPAGQITDDRSGAVKAYRRVMYLWFFDPQRRTGAIRWLNPVMVKEFRSRAMGRGHWLMRLIAGCCILSLGLAFASTLTWHGRLEQQENIGVLGGLMVVLQLGLLLLITPSLASGLISAEREGGGWQLLQMTPLSAFRIMVGKLMSVFWLVLLVLLATLPGYAVMIVIQPETLGQVVDVLITLGLTALVAVMLSVMISSIARTTTTAIAASYSALIIWCLLPMLIWLGQDAPFSRTLVEQVLVISPLATALSLIETPGFAGYSLVPQNWMLMAALTLAMLLVLIVRLWQLIRPS